MKVVVIEHGGYIHTADLAEPIFRSAGTIVGGHIEFVYPMKLKRPYCMICNEDFIAKRLPLNEIGCFLYGTESHGHPICGNIIITKIKGEEIAELTGEEINKIIKIMENLKQMIRLM